MANSAWTNLVQLHGNNSYSTTQMRKKQTSFTKSSVSVRISSNFDKIFSLSVLTSSCFFFMTLFKLFEVILLQGRKYQQYANIYLSTLMKNPLVSQGSTELKIPAGGSLIRVAGVKLGIRVWCVEVLFLWQTNTKYVRVAQNNKKFS